MFQPSCGHAVHSAVERDDVIDRCQTRGRPPSSAPTRPLPSVLCTKRWRNGRGVRHSAPDQPSAGHGIMTFSGGRAACSATSRSCASRASQAAPSHRPRPLIAEVEYHRSELSPRIGFIVPTLTTTNRTAVRFYYQREPGGTVDQGGHRSRALDSRVRAKSSASRAHGVGPCDPSQWQTVLVPRRAVCSATRGHEDLGLHRYVRICPKRSPRA